MRKNYNLMTAEVEKFLRQARICLTYVSGRCYFNSNRTEDEFLYHRSHQDHKWPADDWDGRRGEREQPPRAQERGWVQRVGHHPVKVGLPC